MAKILGVGIATLDIINTVNHYPQEDEELRASTQRITRGGNVTNTLSVLSQYGHNCYWAGVLCNDSDVKHITHDLEKNKIDYSYCQLLEQGKIPTSYITLNQQTGSRTIVHYRDLPELSFEAFKKIQLTNFDWIHFEARDVSENIKMIQWVKENFPDKPISIEIEKKRQDIEKLFSMADLYIFSKHYAKTLGFESSEDFIKHLSDLHTNEDIICTWGEAGAFALTESKKLIHQPAFIVEIPVDTIGAGDTFNAGIIHGRINQLNWEDTLETASKLAAKKCKQAGFDSLVL